MTAATMVYAANLAWAAERAKAAGVRIVMAPINHRDMLGYFLTIQTKPPPSSKR